MFVHLISIIQQHPGDLELIEFECGSAAIGKMRCILDFICMVHLTFTRSRS